MVIFCSRSASKPSISSARSSWPPLPPPGRREFVLGAAHLVLVDQRGIVKQPADQRALAVVDAAAGEKAQQAAIFFRRDAGIHPLAGVAPLVAADNAQAGHQK